MNYTEFLENKIVIAEDFGSEIEPGSLTECLLPHQKYIATWCLKGGRRAIFASFGLGKTVMQLDIIERLITRFTNPGELVDDPFGGLFSTAYKCLEMGRKAISFELNPEYYDDGLFYLKSIEYKVNVPTLFDVA